MGMMSTLGKVAIGVLLAKTAGKAMNSAGGMSGISDKIGGFLGGNQSNAEQNAGNQTQQNNKLSEVMNSLGDKKSNDLGSLLSATLSGGTVDASAEEEKQAEIILKAMINAAKADGQIDADEQRKITEHIGDISPEELAFVKNEMSSPLDVKGVIQSVPRGMEQQVYLMSLLTIDITHENEITYMDALAKGLHIPEHTVNEIHQKIGVAKLYS